MNAHPQALHEESVALFGRRLRTYYVVPFATPTLTGDATSAAAPATSSR
ncbi:MAG: hypothetical protein JSS27_15285 [Planctomycetes bacterium]|nr:hypothetical protein [Planctomycetota bacterium]